MRVWIFQDPKQVRKHGSEGAAWQVGWRDPEGKRRSQSCGAGPKGRKHAEQVAERVNAELLTGTYESNVRKSWDDFRQEWDDRIGAKLLAQTRRLYLEAIEHFERVVKPARIAAIKTQILDEFVAKRKNETGRGNKPLSVASINKELRHLRAVFNIAVDWGYLENCPKCRMLREPSKLATFIPPDHFAKLYAACDHAEKPKHLPYAPGDWWRGLLAMGYMTGWRISEMLSLRRDDVDLEQGEAITRAENNKGKRDDAVRLHPFVVEHLRKLPAFEVMMFPWRHNTTTLYNQFRRLQKAAGVDKGTQDGKPVWYGFHDLRRGFATMNAKKVGDALQQLMRHKSYLTTKRYINMASQVQDAVDVLYVPNVAAVGS